jgi:hypothetical protein
MAPRTNQANASTPEPTETIGAKRAVSAGVILGRIAEKLAAFDVEEAEALAKSPEVIKAGFAKKREKELEGLTQEQREGVLALAKVLAPKAAE